MKTTNPIHKLSALIGVICSATLKSLERARICALLLCGLILLPLTASATNLGPIILNGGALDDANNERLSNSGTTTVIRVQGGGVYTGTAMLISSTFDWGYGLLVSGGTATVVSSTLQTTGAGAAAVQVRADSVVSGSNLLIETQGANGYGASAVASSGFLTLHSSTIRTNGSGNGFALLADAGGHVTAGDLDIETTGYYGLGAISRGAGSELTIADSRITTSGSLGVGLWVNNNAYLQADRVSVLTQGDYIGQAAYVLSGGTLILNDSQLAVTGNGQSAVRVSEGYFKSNNNVLSAASGPVVSLQDINADIVVTGGTLAGEQLLEIGNQSTGVTGTNSVVFNDVDLGGAGGIHTTGSNVSATEVTVNGGSGIVGDIVNTGSGSLGLNLNDSSVTGNVNNNNGTVSSSGSSTINGDVNSSLEVSSGTLTVTGSVTVDNGQSVTGNGTLTVGGLEINDGGTLGGGLTIGTDSATRIVIGLSSATLYHEFGSLTEIGADTLKLGDNIALDLSGIDGLSGFTFAFTDEVQDGNFTLILGEAGSLESWSGEVSGNISGLTLSGQNEVTADITITLNGEGSALTATLSNVSVNAVPEPSTYFLLGTGLGALLLAAHRRRRKAQS